MNTASFNLPSSHRKLRTLLKVLKWVIGLPVLLIVVLFVALIAINWRDEELSPLAQSLLQEPKYTVPDEKNGFYISWAMNADKDVDAVAAGKKQFEAARAAALASQGTTELIEVQPTYALAKLPEWKPLPCAIGVMNCLLEILERRKEIEGNIAASQLLMNHYHALKEFPDWEEHVIPSFKAALPSYQHFIIASDIETSLAVYEIADGSTEQGLQRLSADNTYLRWLLPRTSTLIARMVITRSLLKQTRVVNELIEKYPQLINKYAERTTALLKPMSPAELDMRGVLRNEALFSLLVVKDIRGVADFDEEKSFVKEKIGGLFFQKNATINLMAQHLQIYLDATNSPIIQDGKVRNNIEAIKTRVAEASDFKFYQYASNPVGKILVQVGTYEGHIQYLYRAVDAYGYLNLSALHAAIRTQQIPEEGIAAFIEQSKSQYDSPYPSESFSWDVKQKQLIFKGREKSRISNGKSDDYVIQM